MQRALAAINKVAHCLRVAAATPVQFFLVFAPIGRVNPGLHMAAKTGIRPIHGRWGQAVLDGVVMDVVNMVRKIGFVAQLVLPIPLLPDGLRALVRFTVFGEPGFYQAPAGREISIARRQGPDAM
jgi:hypothetical protein